VLATSKGQRDIRLFFDKKTGLLVKIERQAFDDATKKEVPQEEIFSDFKDVAGLQTPMKQVWRRAGKNVLEVTFRPRCSWRG
jgi:hypothetical protein